MIPLGEEGTRDQAARCMDCGIPFCHTGCPVNNQIPDWNDLVYNGDWREALRNLQSTNNFPEMTGTDLPGALRGGLHSEHRGHARHHQDDREPPSPTAAGRKAGSSRSPPLDAHRQDAIAIVGSGPAGLAAAQQQSGRAGHEVHVFERQTRAGGLMRYGIPDFKMEKHHLDRRVQPDGAVRA